MNYCSNCGTEVNPGADICLNCGKILPKTKPIKSEEGKVLATLSVIFGSLGFYPLIFVGSIAGIILGAIAMNKNDFYHKRGKIGAWLSISSLILWIIIFILIFSYA